MILLFFINSFQSIIDMYDDSFAMVNRALPNLPLTLYNSLSEERTLPLRLTEIRPNSLDSQLFMIRFNFENKFWLSSVANMNSRTINAHPYFVMRKKPADPNLTLEVMGDIHNERVYKIISDDKCLTVEDIYSKGEDTYYPLTFKDCISSQLQEFVFIPRIAIEKFLKKKEAQNINTEDVKEAYTILYKKLKISMSYNKNRESKN